MKKFLLSFAASAAAGLLVVSCDLDAWLNDEPYSSGMTVGTADLTYVGLGYIGNDVDLGKYKVKQGKDVAIDYSRVPLVMFNDEETCGGVKGRDDADVGGAMRNNLDYGKMQSLDVVFKYRPDNARVKSLALVSSDEDIISIGRGDAPMSYKFDLNGVGECDVTLTVEGNRTAVRTYRVIVTETMTLKVYMDAFWLNNVTARLKYKTKSLPGNVKSMYMNVQDSATVIGMSRAIDQRRGEKTFRSVGDTTAYRLRQHTDRFRKGKRVILRNVSDAVRKYNNDMFCKSYLKVDESAKALYSASSMEIPWSIRKVAGETYDLTLFKGQKCEQSIRIDSYQVAYISRTMSLYGGWPHGRSFEKVGGEWYMTFREPYVAKQVQLGMAVISNNPYLFFDVVMKKSQAPSETDDDEDDDAEDEADDSEMVVDTLRNQLKDYFVVHFVDNLSLKERTKLSKDLDSLIRETPDSTKWVLDVGYDFGK